MVQESKILTREQLAALQKMGSVGAKHAATALSQLAKKKFKVTALKVTTISPDEMPRLVGTSTTQVAGIYMSILGDATGRVLFLLPRKDGLSLADILRGKKPGETKTPSVMDQSALKEATTVLTGAYTAAISQFLGILLLPSVPYITFDQVRTILGFMTAELGPEKGLILVIGTELSEATTRIKGHFLLIPDMASVKVLLKAIESAVGK